MRYGQRSQVVKGDKNAEMMNNIQMALGIPERTFRGTRHGLVRMWDIIRYKERPTVPSKSPFRKVYLRTSQ